VSVLFARFACIATFQEADADSCYLDRDPHKSLWYPSILNLCTRGLGIILVRVAQVGRMGSLKGLVLERIDLT
jgi:hypothetical protein